MKRIDKQQVVQQVADQLIDNHFYVFNSEGLTASEATSLRRACHDKKVKYFIVKNSLLKKALKKQSCDYSELEPILKGNTSVMIVDEENIADPAKIVEAFCKKNKVGKPVFKGAYVDETFFVGAEHFKSLLTYKTKPVLIAELIKSLQQTAALPIFALQQPAKTVSNILQTLSEK